MGPIQGMQVKQTSQYIENGIYGSAGIDSQSSYVSSSGVKSILLNAWNAIKSAVSSVLSSFGNHLSGQQGSTNPGREITMDMASRPAQPVQDFENFYASVDEMANIRKPPVPAELPVPRVPNTPRPSLSEPLYSEINDPLYEEIDGYQPATKPTPPPDLPPPVPDSPRPSLHQMTIENSLYESSESLYDNAEWESAEKNWG